MTLSSHGSFDLRRTPFADDPPTIMKGHDLGVISIDVNNDGSMAYSSSLDSQIIIWDLKRSTNRVIDCSPSTIY